MKMYWSSYNILSEVIFLN